MNDELNEQLSVFMDGELSAEEVEAVLQAAKTEESMRARWANYHLIHDSLQRHLPAAFLCDVAGQVSRALEGEPPPPVERHSAIAPTRRLRYRWRYAAGLALAASLSAITVVGVQVFTSKSAMPESQLAATAPSAFSDSRIVSVAEGDDRRRARLEPEVERRLSSYLVNHTEYIDMPRMIRYGRIVSYENPR